MTSFDRVSRAQRTDNNSRESHRTDGDLCVVTSGRSKKISSFNASSRNGQKLSKIDRIKAHFISLKE